MKIAKLRQGLCLAMGSVFKDVWFNTGGFFCILGSTRHNWKGVVLVVEWTNGTFILLVSFVDIGRLCNKLPQNIVAYNKHLLAYSQVAKITSSAYLGSIHLDNSVSCCELARFGSRMWICCMYICSGSRLKGQYFFGAYFFS